MNASAKEIAYENERLAHEQFDSNRVCELGELRAICEIVEKMNNFSLNLSVLWLISNAIDIEIEYSSPN